jgi:putative chitinase
MSEAAPPAVAPAPAAQVQETPLHAAIRAAAPHLKVATLDVWAAALRAPAASSGITTPRRLAAFMGQVAVESGGFTEVEENLNYSAERLCEVWPSRFPSLDDAQSYAFAPMRLANYVYANRNGNGDPASGDGWTFRGRGLIQLTGRVNYVAFCGAIKRPVDQATDWVATPEGAADAACWFWSAITANKHADAFDIETITRRVNGGLSSYQQRLSISEAVLHALSPAAA